METAAAPAADTAFSLAELEQTEAHLWQSLGTTFAVGVVAGCLLSASVALYAPDAIDEVAKTWADSLSRIVAYVSVIIAAVVALHLRVWELAREAKKDAAAEATTLGRLAYYEMLAFLTSLLTTVAATILTIACVIDRSHGTHILVLDLTVLACACLCADTFAIPTERRQERSNAASQARLERLLVARELWPAAVSSKRTWLYVVLRGVAVAAIWGLVAACASAALDTPARMGHVGGAALLLCATMTLQGLNQWLVVGATTSLVCRRVGQAIVIGLVALGGHLLCFCIVLLAFAFGDWRAAVAVGGVYMSTSTLMAIDLSRRGSSRAWATIGSPVAWGVAGGLDRAISWERRDPETPAASTLSWYGRLTGVSSGS